MSFDLARSVSSKLRKQSSMKHHELEDDEEGGEVRVELDSAREKEARDVVYENALLRVASMPASLHKDSNGETPPLSNNSSQRPLMSSYKHHESNCRGDGGGGWGKKKERRRRAFRSAATALAALVGFFFVAELMVILAFLAGPLYGTLDSLQNTLKVFEGSVDAEGGSLRVALHMDTGENLTEFLNGDLMAMGAKMLGPMLGHQGTGAETDAPQEVVVMEMDAMADMGPSAFVKWCLEAGCMGGATEEECASLDEDMLTAQKDGVPVIPLPAPFCKALGLLSEKKCLCEASGLGELSADTQQLVSMASLSATMCGLGDIVAPGSEACGG